MRYFRFISGVGMAIVFVIVVFVAFGCCVNGDITGIQLLLITACAVLGLGLSVELLVVAYEEIEKDI